MSTGTELRAVFYARVSTEEEKQLNALEKQIHENKDVIRDHGWRLVMNKPSICLLQPFYLFTLTLYHIRVLIRSVGAPMCFWRYSLRIPQYLYIDIIITLRIMLYVTTKELLPAYASLYTFSV